MSILRIAVPGPFRSPLDYLPAAEGPVPEPGTRVRVPLGRRHVVGVVVGTTADSEIAATRLRAVSAILDPTPMLAADLLRLGLWAADYYQHPVGEVLAQMLPTLARRTRPTGTRTRAALRLTPAGGDVGSELLARAPARRRALEGLRAAPEETLTVSALADIGVSGGVARALVAAGWAERIEITAQDAAKADATKAAGGQATPTLTPEQSAAAAAIAAGAGFRTLLLDGVTGSGKTEVYFAAMQNALAAGQQVLMLVPEIGLTPQTLDRIRARFPHPLAVLHSGLGDRMRLAAFEDAAGGRARIVVGTRSAVFAPLPEAGLLIVDEEHDESYKQQDGFRYSARDLAVKRASLLEVPIVLGSATPSLESLANARAGRYAHLRLEDRVGGARMPTIDLVDTQRHPAEDGLSGPLLRTMTETLARDEQVLVFLNRRGFAPVLMCRGCGWLAECPRCDARFTVHTRPASLRCHHCGTRRPFPPACPECGDVEPQPVGAGTQRTEQRLREHFPDVPVIRIDRDTTRSASALGEQFARLRDDRAAILVGTQMIAKGHHFPRVTLAAIVGADAGFFSADFRASERQAQILLQVAGRAGRAERPGQVLIQTRVPDHPLLRTLLGEGYGGFAELALAERRQLGLPPFGRLALIRAEAVGAEAPDAFLRAAADRLRVRAGPVQVLGPVPALMPRRAGRDRAQLLLQAPDRASLHALLAATMTELDELPAGRKVRWSLDVDPADTL